MGCFLTSNYSLTTVPLMGTRKGGKMSSRSKKDLLIYQLKVTLKGSKPPIWRRIQIASNISLAKLHRILQTAMGWTDSHLHQFVVGGTYYGTPTPEFDFEVEDEGKIKLSQAAPGVKKKIVYEYDFGDGWEHEILVEKILQSEPGVRYPVCLAGKRACPPEDCGGVWGYESLLEALRDPEHPEHNDMLEWVGGDFDPEAFDLDSIKQDLQSIR
jgi:hypothetical protein